MAHPDSVMLSQACGEAPPGLDAAITQMVRAGHVTGASVAVVNRERVLFSGGYGFADVATAAPATPGTSYLWFSMSKLVTATAAQRLADEGRLDLDAPAAEYLPRLRAPGPQPTVRQLLVHTAGLANPLPLRWVRPAAAPAPDQAVLTEQALGRRRAFTHPVGGAARYSNIGYLAVGQVISIAAGMPFDRYVQRAVLDPAGMRRTGYGYPDGAVAATGYVRVPRLAQPALRLVLPVGVAGNRHGQHLSLNRFLVNGAAYGGLVGDVLDVAEFLRLHLNDGTLNGHRVLSTQGARSMRVIDRPGKPFDHGLGWFREPAARRARNAGDTRRVEHYGAGAGFWNVARLHPDKGVGIALMTNSTARPAFEPTLALLASASYS